jgi:hypothetical protein
MKNTYKEITNIYRKVNVTVVEVVIWFDITKLSYIINVILWS